MALVYAFASRTVLCLCYSVVGVLCALLIYWGENVEHQLRFALQPHTAVSLLVALESRTKTRTVLWHTYTVWCGNTQKRQLCTHTCIGPPQRFWKEVIVSTDDHNNKMNGTERCIRGRRRSKTSPTIFFLFYICGTSETKSKQIWNLSTDLWWLESPPDQHLRGKHAPFY